METTRVTRARAAKSATAATSSTAARAKATAAAKAKAAAITNTTTTTTTTITNTSSTTRSTTAAAGCNKRKTRTDDTELEDAPVAKTRVGRPRKDALATASAAASSAEADKENVPASKVNTTKISTTLTASSRATLATRGRPKRVIAEPAKATRGRVNKKTQDKIKADEAEQAKKPSPQEPAALESAPAPAPAAKSGPKKTVTFLSPEKENVDPVVPAKGKNAATATSTGSMRGRGARSATTAASTTKTTTTTATSAATTTKTAGRTTRTAKAAATADAQEEKALPLSPKKVTQMPITPMDLSDDELALPDKPLKGILKSAPRRPVSGTPKKAAAVMDENENETENGGAGSWSDDGEDDSVGEDAEPAATMTSPAKRIGPSPYQDAMRSPAKRAGGIQIDFTTASGEGGCESSSLKTNLMQTPAKRLTTASPIKIFSGAVAREQQEPQGFITSSMFSSPAKRPGSAIKQRATPARAVVSEPIDESAEAQPAFKSCGSLFSKLVPLKAIQAELDAEGESMEDADGEPGDSILDEQSPTALKFPGRLSSILARHDDPIIRAGTVVLDQSDHSTSDSMALDDEVRSAPEAGAKAKEETSRPDAERSVKPIKFFGLRQKDLDPHHDDDSEDEEAAAPSKEPFLLSDPIYARLLATPTPGSKTPKTPKTTAHGQNALARQLNAPKLGFTPLVKQLSSWAGGSSPNKDQRAHRSENSQAGQTPSPSPKRSMETCSNGTAATPQSGASTPGQPHYSDEAMASTEAEMLAAIEAEISAKYDAFGDVVITDEDMDLAAEAREMSLLEPEEIERRMSHQQLDEDSVSESSQDYGDENRIPIDPALAGAAGPFATPKRALTRTVHTVSKVPLKPADDATPSPVKKRSASASRLQRSRPAMHSRNATVISYSPTQADADADTEMHQDQVEDASWSDAITPSRTPRRDIDGSLLRGAIVYVDVRTSEGADASNIFVELLTQMGAKCVKTWAWNPSTATGADGGKIGITHVVFKDGTKRTLEKVRESGGVVQCVGVSWVLDCEKQNEWLEETPYYIDSAPRDAPRRRKSMEPKVLSNINGTIVSSPVKQGHGAISQTAPNTPMNRRDSSVWQRQAASPQEPDDHHHDDTWDHSFLTPVPATPAPDAIARYAAQMAADDAENGGSDDGFSPDDTSMLKTPGPAGTKTCPPKQGFRDVLDEAKNEGVLMRLMAARRKSLQFAPKIGSPLARSWK